MNTIQHYLSQWVFARKNLKGFPKASGKYCCLEEFVLAQGREWTYAPKPKSVPWGKIKCCYENALKLVMDRPALIYCEGYASKIFPVLHAWCVDLSGTVIDNTWREDNQYPPCYFGIAFKRSYLMRSIEKNKYHGLIDNWWGRWPLLREKPSAYRHPINDSLSQPPES